MSYIYTKFSLFTEKLKEPETPTFPRLWLRPKPMDKLPLYRWMLSFSEAIRDGEFLTMLLEDELPSEKSWGSSADRYVNYMSFELPGKRYEYRPTPLFIQLAKKISELKSELSKLENSESFDVMVPRLKEYKIGVVFTYNKKNASIDHGNEHVIWDLKTVEGPRVGYGVPYDLTSERDLKDGDVLVYTSNTNSGKSSYLTIKGKSNYVYRKIETLKKEIERFQNEIINMDLRHIEEFIEERVIPNIKKLKREIKNQQTIEDSGLSEQELKEVEEQKKRDRREKAKLRRDQSVEQKDKERTERIKKYDIPTNIKDFVSHPDKKVCRDAAVGDLIMTTEPVFTGSFKKPTFVGNRTILGLIEKESYGSERGQHSFTIYVLDSEGEDAYPKGAVIIRKGRTLYKDCSVIDYAEQSVRDDKHERGLSAKNSKYWNWMNEAEHEGKMFKIDKIPRNFIQENSDVIKSSYPSVAAHLNIG